jgi:hypothetical protein
MDSNKPTARPLLTLLQAIVDKAKIDMLPYAAVDKSSAARKSEIPTKASSGWKHMELRHLESQHEEKIRSIMTALKQYEQSSQSLRNLLDRSAVCPTIEVMQAVAKACCTPRPNDSDQNPTICKYREILETEEKLNQLSKGLGQHRKAVSPLSDPVILLREISDVRTQLQTRWDEYMISLQEKVASFDAQLVRLRLLLNGSTESWSVREANLNPGKTEAAVLPDQLHGTLLEMQSASQFPKDICVNLSELEHQVGIFQEQLARVRQ